VLVVLSAGRASAQEAHAPERAPATASSSAQPGDGAHRRFSLGAGGELVVDGSGAVGAGLLVAAMVRPIRLLSISVDTGFAALSAPRDVPVENRVSDRYLVRGLVGVKVHSPRLGGLFELSAGPAVGALVDSYKTRLITFFDVRLEEVGAAVGGRAAASFFPLPLVSIDALFSLLYVTSDLGRLLTAGGALSLHFP